MEIPIQDNAPDRGTAKENLRDCLMIGIVFALPILILRPFQNFPFPDDWGYAWAVEWLLKHGELRVLELSTSINPAQTLWGWLFCLPFGFSFSALRASTWVASVLCLCGLYLTLREFHVPRRDSLIGVAALAAYPIFFILSFTYMTDVPFLTAVVWSCLALVRAVRRESGRWLAAASLFACTAMAIRLPAIILPGAMLAVLLFDSGGWGRRRTHLLAAIVPLVFLALLLSWHRSHVYYTADLTWVQAAPANKLKALREHALRILPQMLMRDLTFTAGALGVALLPITLACIRKQDRVRVLVIGALLGATLMAQKKLGFSHLPPLETGQLWSVRDLGGSKEFIAGHQPPSLALGQSRMYLALTMLLGAVALALLVRRRYLRGEFGLIWWVVGQFVLAAVIWLLWDRYFLVFVPAVIVLLLAGRPVVRPAVAITLIALFAVFSLMGTRNDLEYNRAVWAAVDDLRKNGVPDSQIGGGYAIDGWLQYAHPENALRDKDGKIQVAWMTTRERLRYQISNRPLPGWKVLKAIPYQQWLGESGSVWILERTLADAR
jgi:4-amino-4-deoxy-L-arabinose transferase-like glycosyltransferase